MSSKKSDSGSISLVTGGSTGLGSAIIRALIERGDEVRAVIREAPDRYPDWKGLPAGVIPYVADLTFKKPSDQKNLEMACKGVNRVFHIAGASLNSTFTYNQLIETNVIGTENLIKCILAANEGTQTGTHLVYSSSATVYGYKRPGEVITEQSAPKPASHYSESKLMAEHLIESFGESHKSLAYTIMRIGTIYGPGYERPFFKAFRMVKEQRMRYIGKGNNHLTLAHVDDVVTAMLLAVQKSAASGNQIFNLTDGMAHTPRELFALAARLLGVQPPEKTVNPAVARLLARAAGINYDEYEFLASDRIIDITKIRKALGFAPARRTDVDGLVMVEDFMKSYKKIRA